MRHITLMLKNGNAEDIEKVKGWCHDKKVQFEYRYSRRCAGAGTPNAASNYYFTIVGNTELYNELKEFAGECLMTTDYADICNIADEDDGFEEKFRDVITALQKYQSAEIAADRKFLDFLMPIKNKELLEAVKSYSGHMSAHQRQMLDDRIQIVSGKIDEVHEEFIDDLQSIYCDVRKMREATGMNRREFCEYFGGIPYRTVECWETGKSTCSTYLYRLMRDKLVADGKLPA